MRLPLRGWASFLEQLGFLRRNRRQRKAAAARRRRSVYCRLNTEPLEPRVVMDGDSPTANDDGPYYADFNTQLVVTTAGVLANDTDTENDALTASLVSGPSYASSFMLHADGTFDYTPVTGFNGDDSFRYVADDGTSGSNWATVAIHVNNNHAPTLNSADAAPTLAAIDEDVADADNPGTLVRDLIDPSVYSGYTSDAEGNSLGLAITGADTSNGSWQYTTDGSTWYGLPSVSDSAALLLAGDSTTRVRFLPSADFHGDATLTFRLWDGTDGNSNGVSNINVSSNGGTTSYSADYDTTTITANPVNDAPVLVTNSGLTLDEGTTATIGSGSLQASDVDNTPDQLAFTLETAPAYGTLSLNGAALAVGGQFTQADLDAGLLSYAHGGGQTTGDGFTVSDGNSSTDSTSFAITVNSVEDPPVNAPPVLVTNSGLTLDEGTTATIGNALLQASDVDNTPDQLVFTVETAPAYGTLFLNGAALAAGGQFTQADVDAGRLSCAYDGQTTGDGFTFTVSDGAGGTIGSTVFAITVNPVNDVPWIVTNSGLTLEEGTTATIDNTLLRVRDEESGPTELVFTLGAAPAYGTLFFNGTALTAGGQFTQADVDAGLLSYAHGGGQTTGDGFTFVVSDGTGGGDRIDFVRDRYPARSHYKLGSDVE